MDPLTHTLAGASLGQTRFGHVPLGTTTLIIGANLPDIDAVSYLLDRDFALLFRRGWTHGVLAMALLPPLLAGVMKWIEHVRRGRRPTETPVTFGRFLLLSYVAVLSHPALDWLNTYGVRLLMPFDNRWFYGDTLFIIDPWIWLFLATIVALPHSESRYQVIGWTGLAAFGTVLINRVESVPVSLLILWHLGLAIIIGLRAWGYLQSRPRQVCTIGLVLCGLYIMAMLGSSRLVRLEAMTWAHDRGLEPNQIMIGTEPVDPFKRDVLIADDRFYYELTFDWFASKRVRSKGSRTAIGNDTPVATAALTAPELQGFAAWTRFPKFIVEPANDGYRVKITDMRFGGGVIELDRELRPKHTRTLVR